MFFWMTPAFMVLWYMSEVHQSTIVLSVLKNVAELKKGVLGYVQNSVGFYSSIFMYKSTVSKYVSVLYTEAMVNLSHRQVFFGKYKS